jgi:hypothetical protein
LRLRKEYCEFEGYVARPCLKKQNTPKTKITTYQHDTNELLAKQNIKRQLSAGGSCWYNLSHLGGRNQKDCALRLPRQIVLETLSQKYTTQESASRVAQVVESCLAGMRP